MKLELPPLRDRKEDISLLVDHFISKFNRLHNKNICCVTNEVTAALMAYEYPGNVRELENIIEHSFVLCEGEIIESRHLPLSVQPILKSQSGRDSEPATIKQMEIILIRQALNRNKGNRTAAAKQLGIDKSTLFRKMKAFDIKSPE
jgi:transcriptional regulator with PAS, ATPase and Fis domain